MITVLEPTEIAYASEAACGPPYRLKPILCQPTNFEATAGVLVGMWAQFFRNWQPAGML